MVVAWLGDQGVFAGVLEVDVCDWVGIKSQSSLLSARVFSREVMVDRYCTIGHDLGSRVDLHPQGIMSSPAGHVIDRSISSGGYGHRCRWSVS